MLCYVGLRRNIIAEFNLKKKVYYNYIYSRLKILINNHDKQLRTTWIPWLAMKFCAVPRNRYLTKLFLSCYEGVRGMSMAQLILNLCNR